MPHPVADVFRQAAVLNADDDRRRGNVVYLEPGDEVIATGDIHGNRSALHRIRAHADLAPEAPTRLILQEIIHGPVDPRTGHDRSIEVLIRAVRLKVAHPRQVVFLLGNHDVAELTGREVTRAGRPSCKLFAQGLQFAFGDAAAEVADALGEFLFSLPLAVMCPNGTFICHSLPSPQRLTEQCFEVLQRPYAPDDLKRGGAVYEWTWGRQHTEELIDELAGRLDAAFFILGHVHSPEGYARVGRRAITLACDHEHGCVMRFSADRPLNDAATERAIIPVAALQPAQAAKPARPGWREM